MYTFNKAEKELKRWLRRSRNTRSSGHTLPYLKSLLHTFPPGWAGSNIEYSFDWEGKRIKTLTHPSGAVAHINESNVMLAVEGPGR